MTTLIRIMESRSRSTADSVAIDDDDDSGDHPSLQTSDDYQVHQMKQSVLEEVVKLKLVRHRFKARSSPLEHLILPIIPII